MMIFELVEPGLALCRCIRCLSVSRNEIGCSVAHFVITQEGFAWQCYFDLDCKNAIYSRFSRL